MFKGQKIILATKHYKESVIQPIVEQSLGCELVVPNDYDTDDFGTFSGEKERLLPPKEMVLHKARVAMEKYGYSYGIASEGSFGPHPLLPFSPCHEELLAFVDQKSNIDIVVQKMTIDTNYAMQEFTTDDSFDSYLSQVNFPSHSIIVRELFDNQVIAKGIKTLQSLHSATSYAFSLAKKIRLETDMRAMHNPTRMQVIKELACELIIRLQQTCYACGVYGFGKRELIGELPCSYCGAPTELYQSIKDSCVQCDYFVINPRTDKLEKADPGFCQYCNP